MSVRTDVWMDRWNCYCRTDLSNGCFTERAIVNRWCFAFCFSNVCLTYRSWFWSKSLLKMGGYRRAGGMLVTLHPCFYIWYLNTCIQASKIKEWGWLAKKVHWGESRNRDPGHLCSRTVFPFSYTFLWHGVLHTSSTMLLKFRGTTELVSANNTIWETCLS